MHRQRTRTLQSARVKLCQKPKLTLHQQREAIRRREGGDIRHSPGPWPAADIARDYNVHPSTISRELAAIAHQYRFPGARQEIVDLALRYEGRAKHLDARRASADSDQRGE